MAANLPEAAALFASDYGLGGLIVPGTSVGYRIHQTFPTVQISLQRHYLTPNCSSRNHCSWLSLERTTHLFSIGLQNYFEIPQSDTKFL